MKNKLYWQAGVCALILAAAYLGQGAADTTFFAYYNKAKNLIMEETTYEDVKQTASYLAENLKDTPEAVLTAAKAISEEYRYGVPIDEKSEAKVKQVHAVAGGRVEKSGWDREIGLYVKIRHEEGKSMYGNLSKVSVIESERVQRGEIIGSFDTTTGKDFFYDLDEE